MAAREQLTVWIHNENVGTIETDIHGSIRLRYSDAALTARPLNTPVLSCSLLLSSRPMDATAFVDGLLPEGDYRRWLAERAYTLATDSFGLIRRYGRDVAGAVQFLSDGEHPVDDAHWSLENLEGGQLDQLVADLPLNPLAIVDESELSLPGLQAKMLLVAQPNGTWARPLGGRPSTHILKRDSERLPGIGAAECDALALARHVGLTTVNAHIERHADYDCIVVERFDRVLDSGGNVVGRVHQEDACQALGLAPTTKYELHHGGGGPTFQQVAQLLDSYAANPADQLDRLAAVAAFTVMIGNADAHGKNTAFIINADGTICLTPLYDTVPTVLFPKLRSEAAMTLGGAVTFGGMNLGAIEREAQRWHHSSKTAAAAATACAEQMLDAIANDVIDADGKLAKHVTRAAKRFMTTST